MDIREQIAEAIAERFTSDVGAHNPDWDWEKEDGPDNPYYFTRPMAERVESGPMVIFGSGDGCRSMRVPSCREIADAVLDRDGDPVLVALPREDVDFIRKFHPDRDRTATRADLVRVIEHLQAALNDTEETP